mmetsp:Transcript_26359/g.40819  ORF Transcript_26359/g.40819 Transcript_26359/m.40819 type:complete len:454 (-) Transcript_26359:140-1501(-)
MSSPNSSVNTTTNTEKNTTTNGVLKELQAVMFCVAKSLVPNRGLKSNDQFQMIADFITGDRPGKIGLAKQLISGSGVFKYLVEEIHVEVTGDEATEEARRTRLRLKRCLTPGTPSINWYIDDFTEENLCAATLNSDTVIQPATIKKRMKIIEGNVRHFLVIASKHAGGAKSFTPEVLPSGTNYEDFFKKVCIEVSSMGEVGSAVGYPYFNGTLAAYLLSAFSESEETRIPWFVYGSDKDCNTAESKGGRAKERASDAKRKADSRENDDKGARGKSHTMMMQEQTIGVQKYKSDIDLLLVTGSDLSQQKDKVRDTKVSFLEMAQRMGPLDNNNVAFTEYKKLCEEEKEIDLKIKELDKIRIKHVATTFQQPSNKKVALPSTPALSALPNSATLCTGASPPAVVQFATPPVSFRRSLPFANLNKDDGNDINDLCENHDDDDDNKNEDDFGGAQAV